ncbi:lipoyl synthase [Desulfobulbus rhabdoformis]|uniref:lipoyl synthase n=1 Tax=Desulfobulbus rhabdoformis TaxID=34032 RepID=UPI001964BB5A|nr:lipoyl synthase [Desulfobulbus rhabdoformis]MBM9613444.1 lipoyl synthase [Desulfobulbus rhabdoformis]
MTYQPKPRWLKRKLPSGPEYERIRHLIKQQCLSTVCQEAMCPNQFECFGKGAATFMILGDHCSRNCRFCAVAHGPKGLPDAREPERVAEAVQAMELSYCVITSVTRDDLADGGAAHFAATIQAIRELNPATLVEVLIPDFQGNIDALQCVLAARPEVLNHNLETVASLYQTVRPQADYQQSLEVLRQSKALAPEIVTKCGIMVGLGERREEIVHLMQDLRAVHCDILTIGQYLQPSTSHLEVVRYLPPEEFAELEEEALGLGFGGVAAAPFVRSSYQAEDLFRRAQNAGGAGRA